jgi:hypothetical protein
LALYGFDNFRVAMTCRADGDPRVAIEKGVSICILNPHAARALGDERVRARVRRRDEFAVGFDNFQRERTGKRGFDFRAFNFGRCDSRHKDYSPSFGKAEKWK